MEKDHWNKSSLAFLEPYLAQAQRLVQIATGFFTVQGYDLIRESLREKAVQLMVGFDEQSRERLRQLLIDDIMLHLSRWDAANRRLAVMDLVERIEKGRFQIVEHQGIDVIDARARNRDHAKIFICDKATVLVGSSNLTVSGLRYNYEGLAAIEEEDRVAYFVKRFQEFWEAEDTIDLTTDLLAALKAWLRLRPPFEVYLKTIQILIPEEEAEAPRENYKMPVRYQMVVIERLLRQLREYRGAMLVASTGLGKTIMATHTAFRLHQERRIFNVIVFAPVQVQPDWRRAFNSAGINAQIFTRNLLDVPVKRRGRKTAEMETAIYHIDEKYLIIIDESQHFRNKTRARDGKNRYSFERLMPILNEKKAMALLLTATPYSKEVSDLNHQLLLLPQTAEASFLRPNGQFVFPGMVDEEIAPSAWQVQEGEHFFEEFMDLPVATVISTSQVAKDFASQDEQGDYLEFGDEKKWIPKVEVTKVKVPVFLEREISSAIENRCFEHKRKRYKDRHQNWVVSTKIVRNQADTAWLSSPAALEEVLSQTIEDKFRVSFKLSADKRRELLGPLLDRAKQASQDPRLDPKFISLVHFLKQFHQEGRKIILFTERLHSALYLERAIHRLLPGMRVANTVKNTEKGPSLKDFEKEVLPLIKGFAPEANRDILKPNEKPKSYDLLIATDAYSTGVNLQDASVVVNYDLAWTPDVLIQRAGRILRFWKAPRRVHFLLFVGNFSADLAGKKATKKVENRLRKLRSRNQQAQQFSELPLIPDAEISSFDSLAELSSVTFEELGEIEAEELEEFSGVSPFLRHITVLKENEALAAQIPNDISSARTYSGQQKLLYLLLRDSNTYHRILYDPVKGEWHQPREDELLDLLQCEPNEPVANVGADEVEQLAQKGKLLWESEYASAGAAAVERICALYLIPVQEELGFKEML